MLYSSGTITPTYKVTFNKEYKEAIQDVIQEWWSGRSKPTLDKRRFRYTRKTPKAKKSWLTSKLALLDKLCWEMEKTYIPPRNPLTSQFNMDTVKCE